MYSYVATLLRYVASSQASNVIQKSPCSRSKGEGQTILMVIFIMTWIPFFFVMINFTSQNKQYTEIISTIVSFKNFWKSPNVKIKQIKCYAFYPVFANFVTSDKKKNGYPKKRQIIFQWLWRPPLMCRNKRDRCWENVHCFCMIHLNFSMFM